MASDICLLLEGTYPFVRGGVSAWIHQLIRGLPELTFSVVFLGGRRADYGPARYRLPENLQHFEAHYLEDSFQGTKPARVSIPAATIEKVKAFHGCLSAAHGRNGAASTLAARARSEGMAEGTAQGMAENPEEDILDAVMGSIEQPNGICLRHFLFGTEAWAFMREQHLRREDPNSSFLDYFWALRLIHGPIFFLSRLAQSLPRARVYHTVSTGYAGLLGAFVERRQRRPLVLSEHGIYTKERRIDLNQAQWHESEAAFEAAARNQALRELWIRSFESMGRLTYRAANPIISLYESNRERQHLDGAPPERTRVVANGIDLERFEQAFAARPAGIPRVVGWIGRIVPIKDIKTFIRAIAVLVQAVPDAVGWVVGGSEEGSSYEEECRALTESLGLSDHVRFLGHQDVAEVLPQLGLLMLSSISEAQPLVLLEAFASGVPCITTDVGSCAELIRGVGPEDRALGAAGRVVPFADHEALGLAAAELLSHPGQWRACQAAGHARAHRYYGQERMLGAYRQIYRDAMEKPWLA